MIGQSSSRFGPSMYPSSDTSMEKMTLRCDCGAGDGCVVMGMGLSPLAPAACWQTKMHTRDMRAIRFAVASYWCIGGHFSLVGRLSFRLAATGKRETALGEGATKLFERVRADAVQLSDLVFGSLCQLFEAGVTRRCQRSARGGCQFFGQVAVLLRHGKHSSLASWKIEVPRALWL